MSVTPTSFPFLINRRQMLVGASAVAALGVVTRMPASTLATTPNPTYAPFLARDEMHTIAVTYDQTEYEAMIQAYAETQSKDWIAATVAFDGSIYENAGMRLKGNSSLGGGGMIREFENAEPLPVGTPVAVEGGDSGPNMTRSGPGGDLADRDPESLPWLIRLDKNVDDQNHEGTTQFVIRSNNSASSMNEAVALELLDKAGLASQQAAATGFSINGSNPVLRLAIEHPKDAWMGTRFSSDGMLYKAEATGDYSYRGSDPADYAEVFELEAGGTGEDQADMEPLFGFLDFINNASDDEFAGGIDGRLDRAQFITYLAMMDLVANFDDIDGPGNNSYLYVGPDHQQFTVVPWDMNLAFGSMGPGPRSGGDSSDGWIPLPDIDNPFEDEPETEMIQIERTNPEGTPITGGEMIPPDERLPGGEGGLQGGMSNILVERANALADFSAAVTDRTSALRAKLYANGVAQGILDEWSALLIAQASNLIDEATVTSEAEIIAAFFAE